MQFVSLSSNHALNVNRQHYRLSMNMHVLFYEKCTVDRVGKMPSNITVHDAEIKIKYSHLNQGSSTQCVYTHDQDKFEIEYFR